MSAALYFLRRLVWGSADRAGLLTLPWRYRRTWAWLWRTGGWRACWRFLCVKVLARGERVGLALLDPVHVLAGWAPLPRMLEVEVTTACHLRCTYCELTHWPAEYRNQHLTLERFVRLLDANPQLRDLNLTGEGSSFANPAYPAMLAEAHRRGIYVVAIDSFSKLNDEQMRTLIRYCAKVAVSLDGGMRADYERVRRGARWDTVLANVRRFVALRRELGSPQPELVFRYVYSRDNYRSLWLYPNTVHDIGVPRGERDGYDSLMELVGLLEFRETRGLVWEPEPEVEQVTREWARHYRLPLVWSHPSHDPARKPSMSRCAAWAEPYVMIRGHVVPCCAVLMSNRREALEAHAFGNVHETPFKRIWDSKRYCAFRRAVVTDGPVPRSCVGCRAYDTTGRYVRHGVDELL